LKPGRGPQPKGARAAVLLVGPNSCALHIYTVRANGRVGARAPRVVPLGDARWPSVRDALAALLQRTARADGVVIALRASLRRAVWRPRAAQVARAARAAFHVLDAGEEARFLFLGALHCVDAQDGVVAEVEPGFITLSRFRGRVLSSSARLERGAPLARSGLVPTRLREALVVCGSAVDAEILARLARWTGSDSVTTCADALARGMAVSRLRVPVPEAGPRTSG